MLRIDFIQWDLLWSASPTVTFTSNNVLAYSNNGEAIADLYFNQADFSYMDIVIDWSDISAYWDYLPLANRYPLVWKYGAKVYNDNVLVYTGVIFLDTVRIDEVNFRFMFTLLSTTGFMTRANEGYLYTIPGTSRTIDELVSASGDYSLFNQALITPFLNITTANRPAYQYAGQTILSPFFITMLLPNYNNAFSAWDWELDFGFEGGNYVENTYKVINVFPITSGGILPVTENQLCFFMFKERYNASAPFMYECRCLIIKFNGLGDYAVYKNIHHVRRSSSSFPLSDYNLESILYNADEWIVIANNSTATYTDPASAFTIREYGFNNDYWQYSGSAEINDVQIDPDNADVNPFQTLSDLLFLRQAAMVNDAAGNVICKIRPILNDTNPSVSITNAAIGSPVKSGVFIKSVANNIGLNFLLNITDVLNYIKQYFQTILNWYRVKLSITIDGTVNVGLGTKIMYNNHDYVVTRIVNNYYEETSDIEGYGVV